MRIIFVTILLLTHLTQANPAELTAKVNKTISHTIPTITTEKLATLLKQNPKTTLLDTRSLQEFNTSDIPNAHHIPYKNFNLTLLKNIPKHHPIILYCSIGYRSEKIAEKLKTNGYTNLKNLHGGIFQWANQNRPMQDKHNQPTIKVHPYNK